MGLFDSGKLDKMTVRAFKEAKGDDPPQLSNLAADTYTVQVNPSTYTLGRLLNYSRQAGQGSSASEAKDRTTVSSPTT